MTIRFHALKSVCAFALPAALAGTFAASPAGAATLPIASSAYGVWVDLTVLDGVTATIGPAADVSGVAPPAYNLSSGVVNLDTSVDIKTGGVTLGTLAATGVLTSSASSPYPTPTSTATSTVDSLSLDLKTAGLIPATILDVTATTITSTSSASALVSPNTATGSSSIEDLTISGLAVGLTPITITGIVDPVPNDEIFDLAGLTITLNQQTLSGNGFDGKAIVTDAIAIGLSSVPLGTGVLDGQIVIANSAASVPEAATWLDMLAGFGAAGLLMRRRAKSQAAAAT